MLRPMKQRAVRIGLVIGFGLDYYRDIVRGVRAYAASCPEWVLTPIAPEAAAVSGVGPGEHDGLIAQIIDREQAEVLLGCGRPVVNVSGVLPDLPVPRVGVDHVAVGRMAAEHLLSCGLRQFGYVGYPGLAFSVGREAGFRSAVEEAGFALEVYHQRPAIGWETSGLWRWDEHLPRFLLGLKRPAGVFASHDLQGLEISEACRRAGLRVPDEVAIVGVDNDDLLCELARPTLTSVALPAERIGFEAARWLDGS